MEPENVSAEMARLAFVADCAAVAALVAAHDREVAELTGAGAQEVDALGLYASEKLADALVACVLALRLVPGDAAAVIERSAAYHGLPDLSVSGAW